MKRCPSLYPCLLLAAFLIAPALVADDAAMLDNWPRWRGPVDTGVAPKGSPPVEWSETKNVRWKVEIPGSGTSTPVIWGDHVFVQTAIATGRKSDDAGGGTQREISAPQDARPGQGQRGRGQRGQGRGGFGRGGPPTEHHQFALVSIDRATGTMRWSTVLREEVPHEGHHGDHGFSSFSPATDGEYVYANFGSRGVYCVDMSGKQRWGIDLGDMRTRASFGEGSSPAVHGNTLMVNWDHEGDSFIVALDKRSGKELWRKERDERTSWTTPVVVEAGGKTQVIVNGSTKAVSYDIATGDTIWSCTGQTENVIPTPVIGHGMAYLTSGFRGAALQAIRLDSEGELSSGKGIAWEIDRGTPYVPSPLLYDDNIWFFSGNRAQISCHDAKTGEERISNKRLEELSGRGIYASPVGAAGRVYIVDREGTTLVLKNSPEGEVLAVNKLDDRVDASPAIVGKQLFIRGHKSLYCLEEGATKG